MIKKTLTTKAHLVILFLGVINLIVPLLPYWGTYDLNRTIGWGWDLSNYLWYYDLYLNLLWVIVIPIVYWFLGKNHSLFFPLILIQIIVIVLLMFSRMISPELRIYLEIGNWVLFFINIIVAFKMGKGE